MKNREIYQKDPSIRKLANQGVASVNDDRTTEALDVLRYELETFVCDGQYEKGLAHIIDTFLRNVNQAEQPGAWVSGFYGSGKSHLVKMLRTLWVDQTFPDGATARGIARLPREIRDKLQELDTEGKRHGGRHAASGTLGAGASGSVRLALLRVLFKSVGLPERYQLGRFVLWLKSEGIADEVRRRVEESGVPWDEALDNFYVSTELHEALMLAKPNLFQSADTCASTLINLYPHVQDISSDDMHTAIRKALTVGGKFPLTLIVLDEVQQYIGEDGQRSLDVQEMVEDCCKKFGGKLMFIGTGQTAVTGTSNLKRLEGRFTVRVELSDADVDNVIRQVILAKRPEAKAPVEAVMDKNLGEISRHLAGTGIAHRQADVPFFPQDYPILPVRRRFWENALRVLDQTGTDSQLRNQLSMIHKAIQTNLDDDVGTVIPGDYLYFETVEKLIQHRIVPRKLYDSTMVWIRGSEDERLKARSCALIFLLNKLASANTELGLRATADAVADLLVEDLEAGSAAIRARLPGVLASCELVMRVGDEYRIQTEESSAWNDDYQGEYSRLASEAHRIDAERDDRVRRRFGSIVQRLNLTQGASKAPREVSIVTESKLPSDADARVYVWLRDEWSTDIDSVRSDARQAGNQSPTVFVCIPKRSGDDLRRYLIEYKAASGTLEKRKGTSTPEGLEAQASIETIRRNADGRIDELLEDAFSGARVFQGGGNEIIAQDLRSAIREAADNSFGRLYPQFGLSDHTGWAKVYENASKGAPDALRAIGYNEEPAHHPVCKAILSMIAGGKRGSEIRERFEGKGYGWSRDAVDGALQVLLVATLARAQDDHAKAYNPKEIERKALGKVMIKIESTVITTPQRIAIRRLFQNEPLKIHTTPNEEPASVARFLQAMNDLADGAGGEAPKPVRPDTGTLETIRTAAGNEQLLAIYNNREELERMAGDWHRTSEAVRERWPEWIEARRLAAHLDSLGEADVYLAQVRTIERERQLLAEPNPLGPLVANMAQALRDELNAIKARWSEEWNERETELARDDNWMALEPEQKHDLRSRNQLTEKSAPAIAVDSTAAILSTLDRHPIPALHDRLAALPGRYAALTRGAARLLEPKAQFISFASPTLRTEAELDAWIADKKREALAALRNGPVVIK
ncbi:MAG TPA: BREX system P-loop protein BrxC [Spirochaetia bacterium]|nr:BREX system P-loop protein BrxC [Spirochaetia bacterium]